MLPANTLTVSAEIDLIHEGKQYGVQVTRSGPESYFLLMNGSGAEARPPFPPALPTSPLTGGGLAGGVPPDVGQRDAAVLPGQLLPLLHEGGGGVLPVSLLVLFQARL